MNGNQKVVERAIYNEYRKGNITFNKFRELLDVCLAALEEPAQASEPTQTGLKKENGIFDEMHEYPGIPFLTPVYNDSKTKKAFVDKLKNIWSKDDNNVFKHTGGIVAPYDINYVPIQASMKEAAEKDEYDAAMAEWRESFNAWKEKDSETDERINEIADKVNAIYAAVNKLKEPVINNVTTKMHLDDYPLTKRQLDQVADHLKSEIFKTIREDRLKGGFK